MTYKMTKTLKFRVDTAKVLQLMYALKSKNIREFSETAGLSEPTARWAVTHGEATYKTVLKLSALASKLSGSDVNFEYFIKR